MSLERRWRPLVLCWGVWRIRIEDSSFYLLGLWSTVLCASCVLTKSNWSLNKTSLALELGWIGNRPFLRNFILFILCFKKSWRTSKWKSGCMQTRSLQLPLLTFGLCIARKMSTICKLCKSAEIGSSQMNHKSP